MALTMYIDRSEITEYPFLGTFFRSGTIDSGLPLDEQEEKEVVILSTKCDITENQHSNQSDFISATYNVYFPHEGNIEVRNGDFFRGDMYGIEVNGKVVGIFPNQLGGCNAYVQDVDV